MKAQLLTLEELQELDVQIDVLRAEEKSLVSLVAEIGEEVQSRKEALEALSEKRSLVEKEKDDLEVNHSTELENIKRSESHMKEIKTNKEYQAVGREITAAKKLAADLEEQILQKIAAIDELSAEITASTAQFDEFSQNCAERETEKNAELEKLRADIEENAVKRDELVKKLPSSIMRRYSMLREQRRGVALAEARDGSCLGCNLHLPPQLYNTLFKGEEIQTCPHCQRILVVKQHPQQ